MNTHILETGGIQNEKNFKSIAIIISMVLMLTGCTSHKALQQESKTGGAAETLTTDNDESDVNVTIKDISYDDFIQMRMEDKMQYDDYAIIVENDALTYEQRQRLLWGDEQINLTAKSFYPDFEIGWARVDGKLCRTFTNKEYNITVSETYNWDENKTVWISNPDKTVQVDVHDIFCENMKGYVLEERLFMMDVTGDGVKEIIIRNDVNDFMSYPSNVTIINPYTLEKIKFDKDSYDQYIEDNMTVKYNRGSKDNLIQYEVSSQNGDRLAGEVEVNDVTPYEGWSYETDSPLSDHVVIKDNKIYVYDILTFVDKNMQCYYFGIAQIELSYDKNTNSMVPSGEISLSKYNDETLDELDESKRIYDENWTWNKDNILSY